MSFHIIKQILVALLIFSYAQAETIMFKGLEYEEITSPITKRIWLDRNLGAKQSCASKTDENCFGHYYQWGRKSDGHELPNAKVIKRSEKYKGFSGNEFISVKMGQYFDWNTQPNNDLWQGKNAINNVCPKGYKVPNIKELVSEINNQSNFLNLPYSGYKSFCNGKLVQTKRQGAVWSSTSYEQDAYYIDIRNKSIESSTSSRADAFPVRCIKAQ